MSKYASPAKNFVLAQRYGVLGTFSSSNPAYPFGSLTPYAISEQGNILIYISLIAEHYKNLEANQHASLTIHDPFAIQDPQAHARATLLLDFTCLDGDAAERSRKIYEDRFPGAINYEIAHNFVFMSGEISKVRWIGGFGAIGWISREDFNSAASDPLAQHAFSIVTHMNYDHPDAVVEIAEAHSTKLKNVKHAQMTTINSEYFVILAGDGATFEQIKVSFKEKICGAEDARSSIIQILKSLRC